MTQIALQARAVQTTAFSPRLQQAVRLLQLSSLDYAQALHEAADANPFLEIEHMRPEDTAVAGTVTEAPEGPESDWMAACAMDRLSSGGTSAGRKLSHDDSSDALNRIPLADSLQAHLHAQLGVLRLGSDEKLLAAALVESLDDDGYLRTPLEDIGCAFSEDGAIDDDLRCALRTALCRVQSLDPPGVGARDVSECLRLQLPRLADCRQRELARRIVRDHLALLAARNLRRLAAALGEPLADVQGAVDCIRRLNARPGWQYGEGAARIVTPDVIVRKIRGAWTTVFNDATLPRVQLHERYASLFEKHRGSEHAELTGCLERAKWMVQNLTQRAATIRHVAQEIVARQALFLEYGALAMRPLGLREVADAVGVHPSTVSRTAHHKYMATPFGVFEFRSFFSRGMDHSGGGASAPSALKALIGELVAAEPCGSPLSDAELARQLAGQGFRIARRTVTKYRQGLHLAPVDQRRAACSNRFELQE